MGGRPGLTLDARREPTRSAAGAPVIPARTLLRCTRLAAPALALLLARLPAAGQTVAGRVLDAEGGTGLGGAFVVLQDSTGRNRMAVLTDEAGRFVLTAPGAGRYTVVAERLGMTTRKLAPFTLAAGERRVVTLTLEADAVPLAAIEVTGRRRCQLRPGAGEATARVWEEVRKALRVSSWTGGQRGVEFTLRRHERTIELPSRVVLFDSVQERVGASTRPYTSLPAERLAKEGYVQRDQVGGFIYYGPDDEVLASEEFLDSHCLELRPRSATPEGALAVDFRRARRGGPVDIEGTAFLDARSGELRSIEFTYVGLDFPAQEAGGRVEYRRLPGGAWIVERWRLAFPLLRRTMRGSFGGRIQATSADEISAYALHETTGEVVRIRLPGALAPAVEEGTARAAGAVAGVVYDSARQRPLAGARVFLSGTVYAASSDDAGRFRIAGVPPGRYDVAFTHPALDSVAVLPPAQRVLVEDTAEAEVALGLPTLVGARRRACGDALLRDAAVLFGEVSGAGAGAVVRASWQRVIKGSPVVIRTEYLESGTDAGGRYLLCGIPGGAPVALRAIVRRLDGTRAYGGDMRVTTETGGVLRADVAAPER
jgi:hypothetical protein